MPRPASRWLRPLLVLLIGSALCLNSTAAQAKSDTRGDPRGDMGKVDQNDGEGSAAPQRTNGDIVSTVFRHRQHRVRIRVTFADLRRSFGSISVAAPVITSEGLRREAYVVLDRFDHEPWSGYSYLVRGDEQVNCELHHSIDYAANVVVIGIPRRCLRQPRWVRLAAQLRMDPPEDTRPYYSFEDDGLKDGGLISPIPRYSRRLFRG